MRISRVVARVGWLMGALLILAGCQNPQYLQVEPKLTQNVPRVGNGQSVTVNVVDGRESDVLGTRDGVAMSTSTITVEAYTLIPQLQAQAEAALQQMGFSPTTQSAEGRPSLTLTLTQLDYQEADAQLILDEAQLVARLRAVVENQNTIYTGKYTSKRTQSYALTPDAEKNTKMVSELLSDALNRTFSDPQIGNLLAR
ncbi:MAG TPA: YajG family lipoprotein [Modicisalibacter sp.]|nr:YajG family lipoprotein [Modicisalibacter sp.]